MPTPSHAPASPLERALDQNVTVQDSVEKSADELLIINTVLKTKIPTPVQTDEVAQALAQGSELKAKIEESATDLAQVNQVLAHEIDERADLERELAATKAALAKAESDPK